ncbi:MAG: peptidyl-prolyl cis-trans isomerase [bacterium]
MRRNYTFVVILFSFALVLGCSKYESKPVAKIGDHVITIGDLEKAYLAISKSARPKLTTFEEKHRFLKDVVNKEILRMEAEKRGLNEIPEAIQAYQSALRSRAWQAYYEDNVRSKVNLTAKYLKDLYERQKYNLRISWILLRSKPLADEVASRLANGESFEDLAKIYSLDASRDYGGDYGLRPVGIMPESVQQKIYSMNVGQIAGPIPYDDFWVFIRLDSKVPAEVRSFEDVRSGLESLARMSQENSIQKKLAAKMKEAYEVAIGEEVIQLFVRKLEQLRGPGEYDPAALPDFSDEEKGRVLARFRGGELRLGTFVEKLAGQAGASIFPRRIDAETVKSVVTDLVTSEIWSLDLTAKGYDRREDVKKFADRAREELAVTQLHDEIVKNVSVSEDTLKDFYEKTKEQYKTDMSFQFAIIVVDTEDDARMAINELKGGKDFSTVAMKMSNERISADRGGLIPRYYTERDLEPYPDVLQLVKTLNVGEYSDILRVPQGFGPEGYMILKLVDRKEPRILTYDEIKNMLRTRVTLAEQDRVFGEWMVNILKEYETVLYPDVLDEIDFSRLKEKKR